MTARWPAIAAMMALASTAAADEARVTMPAALAARVEAGTRWGMVVGVESEGGGALVTISSAVRPFLLAPGYPLAHPGDCDDGAALDLSGAPALPADVAVSTDRAVSAIDVVESVVAFVAQRVVLDEHDVGPQDAASVLRRGRARCSGRANLAVGLLRVAGVPARSVHGLLLADNGPRWHRWGEAWLGELGWVPFDPGSAVGSLSPRYLTMRGAGEGASLAKVRLAAIDEGGFLSLPRRAGLRVVPVGGASLRCVVPPGAALTAVLLGPGGSRLARQGVGAVAFEHLLPGPYLLRWWSEKAGDGTVTLQLDGMREVRLAAPPA